MAHNLCIVFLFILMSMSPKCQSWGWLFSSSSDENSGHDNKIIESKGYGGSFSVENFNDRRGAQLVEKARQRMDDSNSCWHNAYKNLFAACSEIFANEEKRSRFAWKLSDCFQKDTARDPFPSCDAKSPMQKCLKKINQNEHKIYLEFYLETTTICHQLQANVFKHETERLVNDLKTSAEYAEDKLAIIEERSEQLLQNSHQVDSFLSSIDSQTQQVAQKAKDIQVNLVNLLNYSAALDEKSLTIASLQSELQEGQDLMKEKLVDGMDMIRESYGNLGREIDGLRKETAEIEKEITKVGEDMSVKMKDIQTKADDIGNAAEISLVRQKEVIEGQGKALEGIEFLRKFQFQALEESKNVLHQLAEYSRTQQEELLQRQEQLHQAHDHLVQNSKAILAAQEAFEAKQATMLVALDKLFALINALMVESRMVNAILFYMGLTFIIHMVSSTKPACLRPRLFIGVWLTCFAEVFVLWYATNQQTWVQTFIVKSLRMGFLLLASSQYIYAICTYRDYEALNHSMLQSLIEKVNYMHNTRDEYWEDEIDWLSWVDSDLPEEVDKHEDPDYYFPEKIGENSVASSSITRKYELRNRRYR